ncbi:MAG TPA: (Fe-S)-binding protein [Thermodesulfobacteriota bacterium]|nr:(Fe-S)-binding protein [Thermodesulfobacteriota bacterium]
MDRPEAKDMVDRCNKCGLCLPACPVYQQVLTEGASPRGRVQLVKNFLEGNVSLSKRAKEIILTCLLCDTCVVNCPSGIRHDHLFTDVRAELVKQYGLNWKKRLIYTLLTNEKFLRSAAVFARIGRNWLLENFAKGMRIGNIPVGKLPRVNPTPFRDWFDGVIRPDGETKGRIFYFTGCFTNYFSENVGRAIVNVLKKLRLEIEIPTEQDCCGIAVILSGEENLALKNVKKNISLLTRAEVNAVLVDCATCGSAFKKEYIGLLKRKGMDTTRAEVLKKKTFDVMEYVAGRIDELPLPKNIPGEKIRVTYHDPCHLARAQGVSDAPRKILQALPQVEYVEMEEAGTCCGGGGAFQFDFPEVSKGITEKKIRNIRETGARVVVTGCPGCRVTIGGNLDDHDRISILHPMELLDRALSGKGPEEVFS